MAGSCTGLSVPQHEANRSPSLLQTELGLFRQQLGAEADVGLKSPRHRPLDGVLFDRICVAMT